jgi:hypothetical protein
MIDETDAVTAEKRESLHQILTRNHLWISNLIATVDADPMSVNLHSP